jgi:hypothetical protein
MHLRLATRSGTLPLELLRRAAVWEHQILREDSKRRRVRQRVFVLIDNRQFRAAEPNIDNEKVSLLIKTDSIRH